MNTTTEEKNRVLEEFIGLPFDGEYYENNYEVMSIFPALGYSRRLEELRFDTSYNWIVPVAIKCRELQIFGSQSLINDIQSAGARFELGQLHEACYQFALWYKENSHS